MSIFPKKPIRTGDLVIGVKKYGWDGKGAALLRRYFDEPVIVLEIKDESALVFFEKEGPVWYDLTKLERCYVKDEYTEERTPFIKPRFSTDRVDSTSQSVDETD